MTQGSRKALEVIKNNEQLVAQGDRFSYGNYCTVALSVVGQLMAGKNVAEFVSERIWQPMGAESVAAWHEDAEGVTYGGLLATGRDWLRLGMTLANGGRRTDNGRQVITERFISETINEQNLDQAFRPRKGLFGYENQFWIGGRKTQEYSLSGVHGQSIRISQKHRLVMVELAVNEPKQRQGTPFASESQRVWRSLVDYYDSK